MAVVVDGCIFFVLLGIVDVYTTGEPNRIFFTIADAPPHLNEHSILYHSRCTTSFK